MIKKIFLFIILLIISAFIFNYVTSMPSMVISNLSKKGPINSGELKYRVYALGVLPIADVSFKKAKDVDYKGRKVKLLVVEAESLKFWEKIFKGTASISSYIDKNKNCPILFEEKTYLSSKGQTVEKKVVYDQDKNVMLLKGENYKILPNTQDPISALYNVRFMDLNKDIDININTNQKNYSLKAQIEKQDIIVNKQNYEMLIAKAKISRRDGNPYHKTNIDMFMIATSDKDRIPVVLSVFASGFLIKVKLIQIV